MSKYKKIETEIRDEESLVAALEAVGLPFEKGDELPLYDFRATRRQETAEYVIRRGYIGRLANDLGFARQPDGLFTAIISEYDQKTHGQQVLNQVKQQYAIISVTRSAEAQGYTVTQEADASGVIRLQLRRY